MNICSPRGGIVCRLVVIGTLFLVSAVAAETSPKVWSRGFLGPVSKATVDFRFLLTDVQQTEHERLGRFAYENYLVDDEVRPPVVIDGVRKPNDSFWPYVSYAVKREPEGDWAPLTTPELSGTKTRIVIEPWSIKFGIMVSFEPFRRFIADTSRGRVTLPNGDTAEFELKLLKPRDE